MGRIYWACLTFALLSVSPDAFGQYVAVIQACSRDIAELCAPDRPEGSRLAKCTEAHFQDFTEPCQAALVNIAAVREACGENIREQCPGARPSAPRKFTCMPCRAGP